MDIGANLTDDMFKGYYHGKKYHDSDLQDVIKRANECGVDKIVVTVSGIEDLGEAIELSEAHENVYFTIGQHPTHAKQPLEPVIQAARQYANHPRMAFYGEMGLDYDRLHFAPQHLEIDHFSKQLEFFGSGTRPLFLHCRNAHEDFIRLIRDVKCPKIVHSFTGTTMEMIELLDIGCYIGFNGCSFKEEEQLENAKRCPIDRILLESDCPWCEIKPTHAAFRFLKRQDGEQASARSKYRVVRNDKYDSGCMIKARNEPNGVWDVAVVIAALKELSVAEVIAITTSTGNSLLGL